MITDISHCLNAVLVAKHFVSDVSRNFKSKECRAKDKGFYTT